MMLVPMMIVLAAAAAVGASSDPRSNSGAILIQGKLDKKLVPINREYLIPEGQCSGQLTKHQYKCFFFMKLVTLRVTAKSENSVKIEITKNFEAVNIYGCGPVYVTLARKCEWLYKNNALLAAAGDGAPHDGALNSALAIDILHPVSGYEKLH